MRQRNGVGSSRPILRHHESIPHRDPSRKTTRHILIVGHDDDGGALTVEREQQVGYLPGGSAVQVAGGFIGENRHRIPHQGSGDSHPLAFPPPDNCSGR